jgi:hypothetical protein
MIASIQLWKSSDQLLSYWTLRCQRFALRKARPAFLLVNPSTGLISFSTRHSSSPAAYPSEEPLLVDIIFFRTRLDHFAVLVVLVAQLPGNESVEHRLYHVSEVKDDRMNGPTLIVSYLRYAHTLLLHIPHNNTYHGTQACIAKERKLSF